MSHHVGVRLPDGRDVLVDYRQPIVHVLRRVLARSSDGKTPEPEDLAVLGRWLDANPGQVCTTAQIRDGTCTHPPASPEPYTPPRCGAVMDYAIQEQEEGGQP